MAAIPSSLRNRQTARRVVNEGRPRFLVTVDTEGDNLWGRPRHITTRNAAALPAFQTLCERFGVRPTYLTTYEMAISKQFQEFGGSVLARDTAEIGMHLHAWNSPPIVPLTLDDYGSQPYAIEYPDSMLRQKVATLTTLLEDTFGVEVISHRAGRWALDNRYARILVECGYRVDCSVTPHISWRRQPGSPTGSGGSDYTAFPDYAYFVDLNDVSRPGISSLLEVPVTIVPAGYSELEKLRPVLEKIPMVRRVLARYLPRVSWLRPGRHNLAAMRRIVRRAVKRGQHHLEFAIHSSELMAGGSPLFPTARDVARLYHNLEMLFALAGRTCAAMTLHEFYTECAAKRVVPLAGGQGEPFG